VILEVTTAPTLRPLSVSEAAQFLRLDASDENTLLEALIDAARQKCELLTERTLLTTTYAMKLDAFPASRRIALARPPVASVTSVTYYDTTNTTQTLTLTTGYLTYVGDRVAYVYLPDGVTWPSTYVRPDAVTVTYVAGWTAAASVPACLRAWCLQAVATLYENREQTITGTIAAELPREFCAGLLDPERMTGY